MLIGWQLKTSIVAHLIIPCLRILWHFTAIILEYATIIAQCSETPSLSVVVEHFSCANKSWIVSWSHSERIIPYPNGGVGEQHTTIATDRGNRKIYVMCQYFWRYLTKVSSILVVNRSGEVKDYYSIPQYTTILDRGIDYNNYLALTFALQISPKESYMGRFDLLFL